MPVKPEVATFLQMIEAVAVPMEQQTPEFTRQGYASLAAFGVKDEMATVTDRVVPGPAGEIPIRIYVPQEIADKADASPAPVLVYFHGGGFVIGDLETHDSTVRALGNAAGVVTVAVDYRLAPENRFPAAVEDSVAAVRWVVDNAAELGVDIGRLAVGGDSAGGNLAAVVAQELCDSGPAIAFQLLIYPVTDLTMSHASIEENAEGYFLTKSQMEWFSEHYLGDGPRDHPQCSPLLSPTEGFASLPPALIITAEFDPLRDEGEAYGAKLRAAGVEATVTRYDGVIHGFFSMREIVPDGAAAITEAGEALRKALA